MDCSLPGFSAMEFSRQEHWSGLPFPLPGNLPDPGIEPRSPVLQALCCLGHRGSPPQSGFNKVKGSLRPAIPTPSILHVAHSKNIPRPCNTERVSRFAQIRALQVCAPICTSVDTAHVHTHMHIYTHVCPQHCSDSQHFSLPQPARPRAKSHKPPHLQVAHRSRRLLPPFQATPGPSAPRAEAASAHGSHPPLPRKQAFSGGLGFKAEGQSPPHSFLPWSMEKNPFAASNLKNERKEKKLECRKRYLAILGLSSPHKSRPLFPSLTASCHLGRPTGAILAAPLPGSLFE